MYVAASRGAGGAVKLLVLKELRPALAQDPEHRLMFQREATISALLAHPNVVQTYEVGSEGGVPFIAMEYLEGPTLRRILQRLAGVEAPPQAVHLWILGEILAGLHYVHELRDHEGRPLSLVHRDVAPDNVLVTYEGQVKLLDFGVVHVGDSGHTRIGTFKGKASYASPEQVRGDAVDRRSDIFAVGVMLWEVLAGRRMWAGLDELAITRRLADAAIPQLPAACDVTFELRALCEAALAHDPEARPRTAEALRAALETAAPAMVTVGRRMVAAAIERAFADERAGLRRMIESQLRLARDAGGSVAVVELVRASGEEGPDAPTRAERATSREAAASTDAASEPTWLKGHARQRRYILPALGMIAGAAALATATRALQAEGDAAAPPPVAAGRCEAPDRPIVELSGEIERDARLRCDVIYRLRFQTFVRPGASLTIDPGTTIVGDRDTRGTLVIQPGAKIFAEGTRERPIVFTSEAPPGERRPGDWGGLVILGRAPTNLRDAEGRPRRGHVEGISVGGEYGGDDPEDSSGVLRYIRVEYSGIEIGPNNELNGVTFAGVGRGTRVDHVQIRHAADDCFEFFGGTVDASHLICQDPGDDGFDWDLGYTGRLQFLLLRDGVDARDTTAGLEGDNDASGSDNLPRSAPTIFNATLCGRGRLLEREHYGVLLRRGTAVTIGNLAIVGFEAALDVRDHNTRPDLRGGLWSFGNVAAPIAYIEDPGGEGPLADDDNGFDEVAFAAAARVADPDLPACQDPRATEGRYKPRRPLTDGAVAPSDDSFFDPSARFIGAFRDVDDTWDTGWAVWRDVDL